LSIEFKLAEEDYGRVRRRAWWRDVLAKLAGRTNTLLSYQQVKDLLQLGGPIYRGVKQVPVDQIVGSVDRYRDFDEVFLPAQDRTANRWKSVARAYYQDVDLPPVRLYKVGDAYFVIDGHHRVSVAREQGMAYIDAEVQEVVSRVPVSADLKAEDLWVLHEYRRFLERTHLDEIRPEEHIRFTVAGGYDRLLEHIATHRVFMQLERHRDVGEREAVEHWYDTVYKPIVEVIRQYDILKDFPKRTESDLYLWLVEHLYYLREYMQDITIEAAAEDYVDQFSEKPLKKFMRGVMQALDDNEPVNHAVAKTEQARQRFLDHTRLDSLRPDHHIWCGDDLGYARLQEHIDQHRYYMGLDFRRDVPEDEAVAHWYDTVYVPMVRAIRDRDLLSNFPGKRETDLYLSIIEYLDQLRNQKGSVTVDEAAVDYVHEFAQQVKQHPMKKIVNGLQAVFAALATSETPPEEAPAAQQPDTGAADSAASDQSQPSNNPT
jgi:hypothetical protein